MIHPLRLVAALSILIFSAASATAEGVVVTVPPLHSLVGQLLHGVAEPELLYRSPDQLGTPLAPSARRRVEDADMIVRVDRTFERSLHQALPTTPGDHLRMLTLADTVPRLNAADPVLLDRSTGVADSRLWLDPRLAKAAVARLGPNLVRAYPEHTERILDNETALKARLAELETEMREALETLPGVPLHVPQSDVLYLAWRFNLNRTHCPETARAAGGYDLPPGRDLYFALMQRIVEALKRCQRDPASVPMN